MDRENLKKLRPILSHKIVKPNTETQELFQNECLRPIIKLQHDLWMVWLQLHLNKYKIDLNELSLPKKEETIGKLLTQEKDVRNQCIGMIVGHFTIPEYQEYALAANHYNKRIIQMVIERLKSTFEEK